MQINKTLNRRLLKETREGNLLTIKELSEKAGVAASTIWCMENYEKRSFNPSALKRIAKVLEIDAYNLINK